MLRVYTIAVANTMQIYTCYNIVILLELGICSNVCSLVDRAKCLETRKSGVRDPPGNRIKMRNKVFKENPCFSSSDQKLD